MSQPEAVHGWWSRLRHQGLLLSPVVMLDEHRPFRHKPERSPFHIAARLRSAYTRFASKAGTGEDAPEQSAILAWVDALLEEYVGHSAQRFARSHSIPERLTTVVRIGSRSVTVRPHRIVYADDEGKVPALLVMADTSQHVGRGRGRTVYAQFLELLEPLRAAEHNIEEGNGPSKDTERYRDQQAIGPKVSEERQYGGGSGADEQELARPHF